MRRIFWVLALIVVGPAFSADPFRTQEGAVVGTDGVRIRFVTAGRGEPVILIHGFSWSAEVNWIEPGIMEALSQHHFVIALDVRGHGRSDHPHDLTAYQSNLSEDVARVMDQQGIKKAAVVGYSMGGVIAAKFAATHPSRVSALVLCASVPRENSSPADAARTEAAAVELEQGKGMRDWVRRLRPVGQPPLSDAELTRRGLEALGTNDPIAMAQVARSWPQQVLTSEEWERLTMPVYGVVGTRDPYYTALKKLKERLPRLELEVVEGASHVSLAKTPELVAALTKFLAAQSR